jgi:hypothetical protein
MIDQSHELWHRVALLYKEDLLLALKTLVRSRAIGHKGDYWSDRNLPKDRSSVVIEVAEDMLEMSQRTIRRRWRSCWQRFLGLRAIVLIDTPDYSKTDKRMMAKDLGEIYWLWNRLTQSLHKPNIVVAVQKEMFGGHFFFDKMEQIELQPLAPEQMLEAYTKRFKTIQTFTKDALLTLARMSRGIFRWFLRYITLTLDLWTKSPEPREPVDTETVRKAITAQRLAEDMELELSDLFPKHSDLRLQAVQLLLHLSESGPQKQTQLIEELELPPYTVSRLLTKLELHKYVSRQRDGTDKIVNLTKG